MLQKVAYYYKLPNNNVVVVDYFSSFEEWAKQIRGGGTSSKQTNWILDTIKRYVFHYPPQPGRRGKYEVNEIRRRRRDGGRGFMDLNTRIFLEKKASDAKVSLPVIMRVCAIRVPL